MSIVHLCIAACPVNCNNTCTKLCLRNFIQCNPQLRQITIVTLNDRGPFISQNSTGSPTGFDVDLMNYIADLLGVTFVYQYKQFSELISAVQNDINTISISVQTDTIAREQFVNFAQFFQTGTAFFIRSDSTLNIRTLADLCGRSVVVLSGTTQEIDVQNQNIQCVAAGSSSITILPVSTIAARRDAVRNGIAEVGLEDDALLAYHIAQSGSQLKVSGTRYNVAPYGILCNKQNSALCCTLVNSINYLIQRGTYQTLFPRYSFNFTQNGICPSRLNLNGSTCASACVPSSGICSS